MRNYNSKLKYRLAPGLDFGPLERTLRNSETYSMGNCRKILILGAGGMLGHKMYQTLESGGYEVYATFRKSFSHYQNFGIFNPNRVLDQVDVLEAGHLEATLKEVSPDVVINCIGATTRKIKEGESAQVVDLNASLPHKLSNWAFQNNKRLIHFSTDCVFQGTKAPYKNGDIKDAQDIYGLSKSLGEVSAKGSLTIRTSIIGLELEGFTELVEWFISQKNKSAKGFSKAIYSGVTTNWLANCVLKLVKSDQWLDGVHQVSSPAISKFELLQIINQEFDLRIDLKPELNYVIDKTLLSDPFFETTNIAKPVWQTMIKELAAEYKCQERRRKDVA